MAGPTACDHDWLPSRKRPSWDYCPKCGATRNRELIDQRADASQGSGDVAPAPASVRPGSDNGSSTADGSGDAVPEPAPVHRGSDDVSPTADGSPSPGGVGSATSPDSGDTPSTADPVDGRPTWAAGPATGQVIAAGPATGQVIAAGQGSGDTVAGTSSPAPEPPVWTRAPQDFLPPEPIATVPTSPSPTTSTSADQIGAPAPYWPDTAAPVLANPSGVVAPSTRRTVSTVPAAEARIPPPPSTVAPRITRPAPIGAAFVVATPEPEPATGGRSMIRTAVTYALLIALGVIVGYLAADLSRGSGAGDVTRAAAASRSPSASSGADIAAVLPAASEQPAPTLAQTSGLQMAPAIVSLGDRLAGDGIEISLAWRLPLDGTDPSRFDVGVARDGGSFRRVDLARPTSRRASMGALIGPEYLVRLRARTRDGAAGEYAESTFRLAGIEDSSSVIRATKGWSVARHPAYSGTARYATTAGATLSLAFDGTGIAVLGPVGPGRGRADVRVDGERVARIDARAPKFRPHELLAAVDGLAAGPHVLSVTVAGTQGRPMVAVDRFVVLSQP